MLNGFNMKILPAVTFALVTSVALIGTGTSTFAQLPAAPGAPAAGTAPTEKKKPLSPSDKQFLKTTLDSIYFILSFSDKRKLESAQSETVKKLGEEVAKDLNKAWADVAQIASDGEMELPSKVSTADASKSGKLSKAGDKFDKEYLKLLTKETKPLARAFENGAKNASLSPAIQEAAKKWAQSMTNLDTRANDAEKSVGKSK